MTQHTENKGTTEHATDHLSGERLLDSHAAGQSEKALVVDFVDDHIPMLKAAARKQSVLYAA